MKAHEMLEIVLNCVPVEGGFTNPDTGEFFSDKDLQDIKEDLNGAIDFIGTKVLEIQKRSAMKKELANHYKDEAKRDENRAERLQFYLGFLTQGKKCDCDHVSISFHWKQERLKLLVENSKIPNEFKKDSVSRVPDTARITELLKAGNAEVAKFAVIDTRKKATVK